MSNSKDISTQWANDRIQAIIESYDSKGLRASGRFAESLEQKVEQKTFNQKITFFGADYSEFMQFGRSANKNQSPEKLKAWVGWAGSTVLKQWVKDKRLSLNPYAVAWKIARQGIKVPNQYNKGGVISDAFPPESIEQLISELGENLLVDIQSKYIKQWQ